MCLKEHGRSLSKRTYPSPQETIFTTTIGQWVACLGFLDPLLRRATLVVEPDDRAARQDHVGHDEADAGEQLTAVVLDLGNNCVWALVQLFA